MSTFPARLAVLALVAVGLLVPPTTAAARDERARSASACAARALPP